MKKILIMLPAMVILFFITSCSEDEDSKTEEVEYLSEIIINEHEKKFGEISEYGELYERYIYNQDGTLQEKTTNHYLAGLGCRLERNYKYKYDEKKRVIEKNEYELTLFKKKYKYEYNSIDSVSRMYVYNDDGDLDEEWTYEYDNQKR